MKVSHPSTTPMCAVATGDRFTDVCFVVQGRFKK